MCLDQLTALTRSRFSAFYLLATARIAIWSYVLSLLCGLVGTILSSPAALRHL